MILRSITQHVKAQNWFAVGLDFVIVVAGVFLGIQIGNWNEARLDYVAYQQAHERMVIEARSNIAYAERTIETMSPTLKNFHHAVEDIRACRDDADAKKRIDAAIGDLLLTLAPSFQNSAISQLTTSETLLEQQSSERRAQYTTYARRIAAVKSWGYQVIEKMEMRSDDLHPFLDYGPYYGTEAEIIRGNTFKLKERPIVLTVPLSEACKDDAFRKLLYRWEGGHDYQISLMTHIIAETKTFLEEIGEGGTDARKPR